MDTATPLPAAARQFTHWLATSKRASPHTVAAYGRDLAAIERFLSAYTGAPLTVGGWMELDATALQAYLSRALNPRPVKGQKPVLPASKTSLNRQLSSVRSFNRWLATHGVGNAALHNLRGLKNNPPKPRALNSTQTWALLDKLAPPPVRPQGTQMHQRRNFALLIVLYGVGLRISEALSLTRADVQGSTLRITGKGNKQRVVPLPLPVQSALNSYLSGAPAAGPGAPLFPSPSNPTCAITARMAQKMLQQTRGVLGLPAHTTPHALRHTFATHLLENGAGLREVQELLGHASLATTQRYLAADTAQLLKVHTRAHPLK
jgi:integrase/recombinase XerC